MRIDEVIQRLEEIRHERGNVPVRYDDNDFYPSEACYVEYREISPPDPLARESDRLRKFVLLI